ncbi:MAG: alpha/beta hydrolase, partial [Pseudomonadota bacterium]
TRHADHVGGLILISTAARFDFDAMLDAFEAKGGAEAREAAAGYWLNPTAESRARYGEICFPLYYQGEVDADMMARLIFKNPPALHFNGRPNEMGRMDFRVALGALDVPALILAGEDDPITPPAFTEAIHQTLPEGAARYMTYGNCGHGVMEDRPDAMNDVRAFVMEIAGRMR